MKVIVAALLVLSMAVLSAEARHLPSPYSVIGRVYCDTCRAGFETPLTNYIAGAKVKIECRHRHSAEVLYTAEGITDSTGTYKIPVQEDQGDRFCDAVLVSSPIQACGKPDPGRDRSRVILTGFNGMTSTQRFANALGFVQEYSLASCTQVLQQYQIYGDEN
ncbi:hypothetical protein V2J09_002932 [Rumex salicifolius]